MAYDHSDYDRLCDLLSCQEELFILNAGASGRLRYL